MESLKCGAMKRGALDMAGKDILQTQWARAILCSAWQAEDQLSTLKGREMSTRDDAQKIKKMHYKVQRPNRNDRYGLVMQGEFRCSANAMH